MIGVPPNPVTLQNKLYNGTEAYANRSIASTKVKRLMAKRLFLLEI
jgi:hypothetical protein